MRSLVAGALALLAGGCLKANATQCDNGAICPDGFACTELPSLCGPTLRVDACMGKSEFAGCDYRSTPSDPGVPGVCHAGICDECTDNLAGCRYPGWTAMQSQATVSLNALWVASDSDVDVGGDAGTFLHYDGYAWNRSSGFDAVAEMGDVIMVARADGVRLAVTSKGDFFRAPLDSDAWQRVASTGKAFTAAAAASATDVVAVGVQGLIVEFNGSTTSIVTPPIASYPYAGVWIASDGHVFAVGAQGGVVQRVGGTWSVLRPPGPVSDPTLLSVWGRSATDVWMVGTPANATATLWHYDGSLPITPQSTTLLDVALAGLWGTATDIYAIFQATDGTLAHHDGTTWKTIAVRAGVSLHAVAGTDDMFAVGDSGQILRFTGN